MVLAAHLKPLDKGESFKDNLNKIKVWNSAAHSPSDNNSSHDSVSNIDIDKDNLLKTIPKTNLEFIKCWKILEEKYNNLDSKWQFINNIGPERINQIFNVEIDGDLLGKFIVLFSEKLVKIKADQSAETDSDSESESILIYNLLKVFTKCNRFDLNLMFLKRDEINSCKIVFDYLKEIEALDKNDLELLRKKYLKK